MTTWRLAAAGGVAAVVTVFAGDFELAAQRRLGGDRLVFCAWEWRAI
jgi:hypothetical protein